MKKPTVFISYSHADSKFVNDLAEKLKASGIDVWIDKWKIKVGDSITGKINEGIGESDFLIVVLSRTSVESKWVQEEINSALVRNIEQDKHAFILPVLKEDCEIPPILQHRRYANFKDDAEQGFQELIDVISPYKSVKPEMIRIPAGEFLMGSDPKTDEGATINEYPQHIVYVSEYSISKYPITDVQYKSFLEATGHAPPKDLLDHLYLKYEGHPVVNVSWYDAAVYCQWLTEISGKRYRLPTEAEWEKAARGTDSRIYPWGNDWDITKCNSAKSDIGETTPVGLYSPQGDSTYGCSDMAGNVWEWCSSLRKPYPYKNDDGREDLTEAGRRILRGGAYRLIPYLDCPHDMRCAYRFRNDPVIWDNNIVFRVALSPSISDS